MVTRREAIKIIGTIPAMIYLPSILNCAAPREAKPFPPETRATIYKSAGKDPGQTTRKLIDSMGGVESIVGKDDIVILKPNSQWWNQGMTNTDVMAEFIQIILEIPNFNGEIIITDNHQASVPNSRGWTTDKRNGRFNYNELIEYFGSKGYSNVTKYHWQPAGSNPTPLQFDGSGDSVRRHPSEGDGYIWPEDLYYICPYGNKCILAYPVFTSKYSGTTIDLKNGAFKNGKYTGEPVKFINFSALNHHGPYAGVTASVKNYMGVVDMSCGYPAPKPEGTYNTHHVGASATFRWMATHRGPLRRIPRFRSIYEHPLIFRFRYTGGVLGKFMKDIRKADLNIITAVRIGWGSRTDTSMAYQADTLLASTDPVALDYYAAASILLPATIESGAPDYFRKLNDPNMDNGPFRNLLEECRRELGGTINPQMIEVIEARI